MKFLNTLLLAQDLNYVDATFTPNFFIAILAGVLLALVFQLILTALSVAIGITAIGDVREMYTKNRLNTDDSKNEVRDEYEFDQDYNSGTNLGVKITTGFGLWSVITTCISLFAATAIAIKLSLFNIDGTAIALGLVVWSIFFIILFYLEFKFANTVIGGLINTAMSGLRSTAGMVKDVFAPSDQKKMQSVISQTVSQIRSEFDGAIDTDQINSTLNNFFERVEKKIPDYDDLRTDLEGIAKKSKNKNTAGKWMAIQQVLTKAISESSDSSDSGKQGKAAQLKSLLSTVQEKYKEGNTPYEGIANIISTLTPAEREMVDTQMQNFKKYLGSSDSEGFSVSSLQTKLGEIFKNPAMIKTAFENNVSELNKDSIVEYLNQNTNLKKEQIQTYADTIEGQINKLRDTYNEGANTDLKAVAEKRIKSFLNNTGRPEIKYDALQSDFQKIFDNPKQSLSVVRDRLGRTDSGTLRALITSNKYVTEENLDKIVAQFDTAKKTTSAKLAEVQNELNRRVENIKRKAAIQAEHSRKTAASAAWWLVITAVLSAGAAIAGSLVTF